MKKVCLGFGGILFFSIAVSFSSLVFGATPTIDTVKVNASSFNPTEAGFTEVEIRFNVSHPDNHTNLNDTECRCDVDDQATYADTFAHNTSCVSVNVNVTSKQYTCIINMDYWFIDGTWSVNVTIADSNQSFDHDTSQTFTYSQLIASSLDTTAVGFGTIADTDYSTNKTDSNSPTVITNTGNKNLTLNITGTNMTANGVSDIDVGSFYVNNASDANSGQQLTTSSQAITGVLVPRGNTSNTEQIWWFFYVPATVLPAIYSATWTLVES